MKRFGVYVVAALLTAAAGCDGGGIKEGMSEDAAKTTTGQPAGFEDMMKNMGKNMTNQKRKPADTPKAADTPAKSADAPK